MRILLILINAMLVCGIGYGAYTWMSEEEEDLSKYDVPKDKDKVESNVNLNASMQSFSMYSGESTERMVSILGNAINIFDPDRQPQRQQTTRTVTNNQRVDLTLAGTFSFGDVCGAIILQRGNQRNNQWDMFGMGGMGGMGNNRNNNQNQAALAQAQREALEQQIDEMTTQVTSLQQLVQQNEGNEQLVSTLNQRIERIQGQVKTLQDSTVKTGNTSRDGAVSEVTAESAAGVKQFIRVGETMANGYTLSSVDRTKVTLTRPNGNNVESLELTIQDASAGMAARGGANQWNMGGRNAGGWDMMGGGAGRTTTQVGGTIYGATTGGGAGGGGGATIRTNAGGGMGGGAGRTTTQVGGTIYGATTGGGAGGGGGATIRTNAGGGMGGGRGR